MTTTIDTPRLLAKEQATIDALLRDSHPLVRQAYQQLRKLRADEARTYYHSLQEKDQRIAQLEQMLTANLTH